jgi:hypothetical protein
LDPDSRGFVFNVVLNRPPPAADLHDKVLRSCARLSLPVSFLAMGLVLAYLATLCATSDVHSHRAVPSAWAAPDGDAYASPSQDTYLGLSSWTDKDGRIDEDNGCWVVLDMDAL